jgi:hypothetical protein
MVHGYERLDHGDEFWIGVDVASIYLFDEAGDLLKPRRYEANSTDEVTA